MTTHIPFGTALIDPTEIVKAGVELDPPRAYAVVQLASGLLFRHEAVSEAAAWNTLDAIRRARGEAP